MPTYAEHAAAAERTMRRAAADTALRARHAQFDLQAQDQRHKHDRFKFAVVGEGSRSAQDNFRAGYARIFGGR